MLTARANLKREGRASQSRVVPPLLSACMAQRNSTSWGFARGTLATNVLRGQIIGESDRRCAAERARERERERERDGWWGGPKTSGSAASGEEREGERDRRAPSGGRPSGQSSFGGPQPSQARKTSSVWALLGAHEACQIELARGRSVAQLLMVVCFSPPGTV